MYWYVIAVKHWMGDLHSVNGWKLLLQNKTNPNNVSVLIKFYAQTFVPINCKTKKNIYFKKWLPVSILMLFMLFFVL